MTCTRRPKTLGEWFPRRFLLHKLISYRRFVTAYLSSCGVPMDVIRDHIEIRQGFVPHSFEVELGTGPAVSNSSRTSVPLECFLAAVGVLIYLSCFYASLCKTHSTPLSLCQPFTTFCKHLSVMNIFHRFVAYIALDLLIASSEVSFVNVGGDTGFDPNNLVGPLHVLQTYWWLICLRRRPSKLAIGCISTCTERKVIN